GDAEERPLDRSCDGPRIEHVDARIGPRIDAAHDQIRRFITQLQHGDLDAIGRTAADRPAEQAAVTMDLLHDDRLEVRDRVADAALFDHGGDDVDATQSNQLAAERLQPGRIDTIIV